MDLFQYFANHHAQLLYILAGVSFIVELTVMGLGGPLLFFAVACFLTAVFTSFGLLSGWESELFSVGLLTGIIALLLWKPLKRFQNQGGGPDNSSDMIGLQVPCTAEVTIQSGAVRYSGINWRARLDSESDVKSMQIGELCEITGVEGNIMIVKSIPSA